MIEKYINKITCGDSYQLLKEIEDNCIDLHIHSPPYAKLRNYGICKGINPDEYVDWYLPFAKEIYRTLKPNGVLLLNINDCVVKGHRHIYVFELIIKLVKEIGFNLTERLAWNKMKSLCHPKRFRDVFEYIFVLTKSDDYYMDINSMRVPYSKVSIARMTNKIKKRFARTLENQSESIYKTWSPNKSGALPGCILNFGSESKRVSNVNFAVYPESLISYLMKGFSQENSLVCDIFSGSGTSCAVAKKLNRRFLGFELQPEAVQESINRLNSIELPLDQNLVAKIEKHDKVIEDYKEKTNGANFGEY